MVLFEVRTLTNGDPTTVERVRGRCDRGVVKAVALPRASARVRMTRMVELSGKQRYVRMASRILFQSSAKKNQNSSELGGSSPIKRNHD